MTLQTCYVSKNDNVAVIYKCPVACDFMKISKIKMRCQEGYLVIEYYLNAP